jgi:tryptophan synthase alpha subunit
MTGVTPRPQPVVDGVEEATVLATRVSAFIKSAGAALVLFGITSDDQVAKVATVAGLVVVTGGELVSYIYTRVQLRKAAKAAAAAVTPLASPRDDRGVELVPVDQLVDEPGKHAVRE